VDQCRAECGHQRGKDEQCHAGALECGLPPRREADGHHDGERSTISTAQARNTAATSTRSLLCTVATTVTVWHRLARQRSNGQPAAGTAQIRHARRRFECGLNRRITIRTCLCGNLVTVERSEMKGRAMDQTAEPKLGIIEQYEKGVVERITDFNDRVRSGAGCSPSCSDVLLVLVAAGGGMMGHAFPGPSAERRGGGARAHGDGHHLVHGQGVRRAPEPAVSIGFALRGDFPWWRVPATSWSN